MEKRMTEPKPVELSEDRIPFEGIEETIDELVEMFGGEVTARREQARDFVLPLRRGSSGGAVECTLTWKANATQRSRCSATGMSMRPGARGCSSWSLGSSAR
jgi:hypothetical protein